MSRAKAAVGSAFFTVGMPGVMAFLVPYGLTGWDAADPPLALRIVGVALLGLGVAVLAHTAIRFVVEGLGTLFPGAATERLVVVGLYRWVRNPMYVAVISIVLGQAAILCRWVLVGYAAVFWAVVASFVELYDEPTLAARTAPSTRPTAALCAPGGRGQRRGARSRSSRSGAAARHTFVSVPGTVTELWRAFSLVGRKRASHVASRADGTHREPASASHFCDCAWHRHEGVELGATARKGRERRERHAMPIRGLRR